MSDNCPMGQTCESFTRIKEDAEAKAQGIEYDPTRCDSWIRRRSSCSIMHLKQLQVHVLATVDRLGAVVAAIHRAIGEDENSDDETLAEGVALRIRDRDAESKWLKTRLTEEDERVEFLQLQAGDYEKALTGKKVEIKRLEADAVGLKAHQAKACACAFCGFLVETEDKEWQAVALEMTEHMLACKDHPLAKLAVAQEGEIDRLTSENTALIVDVQGLGEKFRALERRVCEADTTKGAEIEALKVREAEAERLLVAAAGRLYDAYHDGFGGTDLFDQIEKWVGRAMPEEPRQAPVDDAPAGPTREYAKDKNGHD